MIYSNPCYKEPCFLRMYISQDTRIIKCLRMRYAYESRTGGNLYELPEVIYALKFLSLPDKRNIRNGI